MLVITNITIVCGKNGPDKISMFTNLPSAMYPYTGYQDINMSVANGKGEEYIKEHFPNVPFEIVKTY